MGKQGVFNNNESSILEVFKPRTLSHLLYVSPVIDTGHSEWQRLQTVRGMALATLCEAPDMPIGLHSEERFLRHIERMSRTLSTTKPLRCPRSSQHSDVGL